MLVEEVVGSVVEEHHVKEFVIKASSGEEKEEWIREINNACKFAKKAAQAGNKKRTRLRPV